MKKMLCMFVLALAAIGAAAQTATTTKPVTVGPQCPQVQQWDITFTASGQSITIPNDCGAIAFSYSVEIGGSPSAVSVNVQGCVRGAPCTTLDTFTALSSANRGPTVDKVYDYFFVSETYTGASSLKVHSTASPFAKKEGTVGGALDSAVVHNTGNENIDGIKTFLKSVIVSDTVQAPNGEFSQIQSNASLPWFFIVNDQPNTPNANPAAGASFLYTLSGQLCSKDSFGVERCVGGQSLVNVNGVSVPLPNFNDLLPAADSGYALAKWKFDGSHGVSVEFPTAASNILDRSVTGTTDTILAADCSPQSQHVVYTGSSPVAVALPTPTTLGVPTCRFKAVNNTSNAVTLTPATWTISIGSGGSTGATLVLQAGQEAEIEPDISRATNWAAHLIEQPLSAGSNATITRTASGVAINAQPGLASISSSSGGINTTETVIIQTPQLPANSLVAGSVWRITAWATCTTTVANVSHLRVKIGSNGSTADADVIDLTTGAAGTTGTNVPFKLELDFTVRSVGSGTSATVDGRTLMYSGANGVQGATTIQPGTPALAGFDSTASDYISLTYVSAATTTTSTFQQATIARIFK